MRSGSVVILGSTVTALGVLREARRLGLSCTIFDTRAGIAMRSRYAASALAQESNERALLRALTGLGTKHCALIATEDRWLEFIAAHRDSLQAVYGEVLVPSNEALRICLDKAAFAAWCERHGLPGCRSWSLDQLAEVRLPALIRPATTLHGRQDMGLPKAVFVDSLDALNEYAARFRACGQDALVSESLLDRQVVQYSVPFAARRGEILSFVARKVRPPASWAATGTCVELHPNAEVEYIARRAVETLDYLGVGEVEILQSQRDGRCYLIEINARPWVQYSIAAASGHDLLGFALGGSGQRAAVRQTKQGVRWLNLSADLYVCFSRSEGLYGQGKLSLAQYAASVLKANAYAFFDWRDPWPAMTELAALLGQVLPSAFRAAWHRA